MGKYDHVLRLGRGLFGRSGVRARRRAGPLHAAVRAALQPLEPRVLLSGSIFYVNDNWHVVGDTVDNAGAGDDGSLHGLTLGDKAFNMLAGPGGALAAASAGDRIVLVSGNYTESAVITAGVSLEGWAYFAAASAAPAENPDPDHLTPSLLNPALATNVDGAQWTIDDPAAETVTVRGMTFTTNSTAGTLRALSSNLAGVAVLDNTFSDTNDESQAVVIDAAAVPTAVNISRNSVSGMKFAVNAAHVTGIISDNNLSACLGIQVSRGQDLTISGNTASGMYTTSPQATPMIGVFDSGAGVVISSNQLVLEDNQLGLVVSDTGAATVAVTGNWIHSASLLSYQGILATNVSYFGGSGGATHVTITGNQVSGIYQGIAVWGAGEVPVTAAITGNTLAGDFTGVLLKGTASATISANHISGPGTGVDVEDNASALLSANQIDGAGTGIFYNSIAAGTITATRFDLGATANQTDIDIVGDLLVLAGGDHFAATTYFVKNESPTDFTLAGDDFGTADAGVIDDRIYDQLDDPKYGLVTWYLPGAVTSRRVFYKGSSFDTGPTPHDSAIATDKSPLMPGDMASAANYTSYDRGLNGLMVDLNGTVSGLTAADFTFQTGNDDTAGNWTPVTATPAITVRPGEGAGGATRVEITFADGAIRNTWLQVTVHLGSHTDLANDDVFCFGNAVGEAGDSPDDARVDAIDALTARAGATASAMITNPCDFNRDGVVNGEDEAIARANVTYFLNQLPLIAPPALVVPARVVGVSAASKAAALARVSLAPLAPALASGFAVVAIPAGPVAGAAAPGIPVAPVPITAATPARVAAALTVAPVKMAKPGKPALKRRGKSAVPLAHAAKPVKRRGVGLEKLASVFFQR